MLEVAIAGVAIAALVAATGAAHGTVATALRVILFGAWVAVLIRFSITLGDYSYWSCPRRGEPFHYDIRWYGRWNTPFARRCLHCGLPKWVESDPDPQRKHEFDPFRIDGVSKFGDPRHKS